MKLRFKRDVFVGTRTYARGETGELPDEQAKRVVDAGHAVPVKDVQRTRRATQDDSANETATLSE